MLVYIVSLKRAIDRRVPIEQHYKESGLEYKLFDAVDGLGEINLIPTKLQNLLLIHYRNRLIPYHTKRINQCHGHPPSYGTLGASLSHMEIWQKLLLDDDHQMYLIVEDDCYVYNFDKLKDMISKLPSADSFDIAILHKPCWPNYIDPPKEIDSEYFRETSRMSFDCCIYILTKRGAGKLIYNLNFGVSKGPDDNISEWCSNETKKRILIAKEPFLYQHPTFNSITHRSDEPHSDPRYDKEFSSPNYRSIDDFYQRYF